MISTGRVLLLGFLLAGAACTHQSGATSQAPAAQEGSQVRVNVTNHFSVSADIYAQGQGIRQRLGSVHPGMSSSYVLPPSLVANGLVEFIADVGAAGAPVRSGTLQLVAGDVVDFVIETNLFGSTARVRPPS